LVAIFKLGIFNSLVLEICRNHRNFVQRKLRDE
jgi:hypothetical protein